MLKKYNATVGVGPGSFLVFTKVLYRFTELLHVSNWLYAFTFTNYNAENYVNRDLAAVASLVAHALNNLSGTGD